MYKVPRKNIQKFIFVTLSLLSLAACQTTPIPRDDPAAVETAVALTFETLTAAAPTVAPTQAPSGSSVSYNNIAFTLPLELNASATPVVTTDVEYPYINPSFGDMPEHVRFEFTYYPVAGTEARGEILVFKAADYASYGAGSLQNTVTALLNGQDASAPFPRALVDSRFHAHAQPLRFQNGHGVRCLEGSLTSIVPIDNEDLFYIYQGITDDGAYFISARLHASVPFLVADGKKDSPTPPDGIPFIWDSPDFDYTNYLQSISQKLNETPEQSFTPSLATLDQLIESVRISAP